MPNPPNVPARLVVDDAGEDARVRQLSARLGAPIVHLDGREATDVAFMLRVEHDRLAVTWGQQRRARHRITVDVDAARGGSDPIVRAVRGVRPARTLRVVDATAGLGKDAFALARAGMDVTAVERDDLLAVLLEDAVQRAAVAADPNVRAIAQRLRVVHEDARAWLEGQLERPDVVLLDPMYPRLGGGAKRRDAAFLRAWLGEPGDDAKDEEHILLAVARRAASIRVVVKRPRKGQPLAPGVSGSLSGSTTRFDVYAGTREVKVERSASPSPRGEHET